MTSGADLFVVCKQCGSEVSPYITECPYCGNRLRRRAPKLPRMHAPAHAPRGRARFTSLFGRSRTASSSAPRRATAVHGSSRWAAQRPYATMLLVAAGCAVWVATHAEPALSLKLAIIGPLHGDWWKLFTYEFVYANGIYAFVVLFTVAIFGWLLERRHGPGLVLALFLAASAIGALVALAVYSFAIIGGANAAALALLAAWVAPDLVTARAGGEHEGDLVGAAVLAALLLALPFVRPEASWLAGVTGGALGLAVGLGMHRLAESEL